MNQVLQAAGVKKQSFHQMMKRSHYVWEETEQLLYLVDQVRKDHPRMSVREILSFVLHRWAEISLRRFASLTATRCCKKRTIEGQLTVVVSPVSQTELKGLRLQLSTRFS